jgi:hypothetical protein
MGIDNSLKIIVFAFKLGKWRIGQGGENEKFDEHHIRTEDSPPTYTHPTS